MLRARAFATGLSKVFKSGIALHGFVVACHAPKVTAYVST